MISIVRSGDRGEARLGWLDSKHTFSFGNYYNPAMMGFGKLRVINEDRVEPGKGFGTHGHRDMEIISYVIDGALEHKDSLGNGSVMRAGDVQRMTAGTGVTHSEFNHSGKEPVHFLQIWVLPEASSLTPDYEEHSFPDSEKTDRWKLLVSREGRESSLSINQDIELYGSVLSEGKAISHSFQPGRRGWLQVVRGSVSANGERLSAGDGAAMEDLSTLDVVAHEQSELVLFDLA